jgi:hypothetical protein
MRKFVVDEGDFGAKFDRVGNQVAARLTDTAISNLTRMSRPDGAPYESMRLESDMDQGIGEVVDAICDSVISPGGQESSGLAQIHRNIERMFR